MLYKYGQILYAPYVPKFLVMLVINWSILVLCTSKKVHGQSNKQNTPCDTSDDTNGDNTSYTQPTIQLTKKT